MAAASGPSTSSRRSWERSPAAACISWSCGPSCPARERSHIVKHEHPCPYPLLCAGRVAQRRASEKTRPRSGPAVSGHDARPVTYQVDLSAVVTPPYKCKVLKVWMPVPPSDKVQQVTDSRFTTFPMKVEPRIDAEKTYGNRFAYFEFHDAAGRPDRPSSLHGQDPRGPLERGAGQGAGGEEMAGRVRPVSARREVLCRSMSVSPAWPAPSSRRTRPVTICNGS